MHYTEDNLNDRLEYYLNICKSYYIFIQLNCANPSNNNNNKGKKNNKTLPKRVIIHYER